MLAFPITFRHGLMTYADTEARQFTRQFMDALPHQPPNQSPAAAHNPPP
jgi:hypothetical protein